MTSSTSRREVLNCDGASIVVEVDSGSVVEVDGLRPMCAMTVDPGNTDSKVVNIGTQSTGTSSVGSEETSCLLQTISQDSMMKRLEEEVDFPKLNEIVFEDERWKNGIEHLRNSKGWGRAKAEEVLREGAKYFGIRFLSAASVEGLVNQLMGKDAVPSPALQRWIKDHDVDPSNQAWLKDVGALKDRHIVSQTSMNAKEVKSYFSKIRDEKFKYGYVQEWSGQVANADYVKRFKWAISITITIFSALYAIKVCYHMYPGHEHDDRHNSVINRFGWPVFFARMGGMACALWTAVLYLTMSRTALTWLSMRVPSTEAWLTFFDAHKDLHVLSGMSLTFYALEHVVMHSIGTIPGLLRSSVEEVNSLLGCANPDNTPGWIAADFSFLEWPPCPVEDIPSTFTEAAFTTMPGLTGLMLVVLISAVSYTGRQKGRKEHFDRFIYLHNVLVILWPILLFLHGSQGWIGVGFPLVIFTASVPISLYALDRTLRALRYYLYSGTKVQIVGATVRAGQNDSPHGAMTYLQISPPPRFWRFKPGMYAFICMPEYAPFQWHPFTICSGASDPTVDFLIAAVGDWTIELAKRAIKAKDEGVHHLPQVAIDGPYAAPTLSALSKHVLIAVGAGVGITPFLSLMSSISSVMHSGKHRKIHEFPLKEAHFYWLTRSVDEFLFGRELFSQIIEHEHLRDKVFLHLHCTQKPPDKDASAFMFREALKRQSKFDRSAFNNVFKEVNKRGAQLLTGPQLPWAWVDGNMQDVIWLSHLVRREEHHETEIAEHHQNDSENHWSSGLLVRKAAKTLDELASCMSNLSKMPAQMLDGTSSQPTNPTKLSAKALTTSYGLEAGTYDEEAKLMIPVVMGRPDFATEIRNIGKSRPEYDVDVYICGNDMIVKNIQEVVAVCEDHNKRDVAKDGVPLQKYNVHYERFG